MKEVKEAKRKYCSQALLAAVIVAVVAIILGQRAIARGVLLGAIFSTINFSVMAMLNPLKIGKSKYKAGSFAFLSLFLRMAILAIPLVISAKNTSVNFFAVVVGIFFVQLVILLDQFVMNRFSLVR
ncbi:MAG: hypothetical protein DRH11_07245 [Deltaproteobacteria bacterium]|nr:ATP synthase subunit I [Deltaproteobacteria bacterium]MBW1936343.1 ATP synthase subunit I [Deltaproteobacteria bacterium]RLB34044.1 MAG: hypothetical protein DRH11_07245 [Deltaproteobacteria bacterium]